MTRKRMRKKRKWMWVIFILIAVVVLGLGLTGLIAFNKAKNTVNDMHKVADSINHKDSMTKTNNTEPLNILLLGVDEREGDVGRSDALMVMHLDPSLESMNIVSIPRDTRTEIVGHGTTDKINHAYAFGGVDMSVDTIENFLNIKIDYFAEMNMEGLSDFVDAVGGITVDNQLEFNEGVYKFTQGPTNMDGRKAMAYVQMRKQDPNGDFGRNARQRQVVQAVIDKGASIKSISKIDDILNALGNNVKTNMDFSTMTTLFKNYRNVRNNSETYQMQGSGESIDGIYYYEIPQSERDKVHDMLTE